MGMNIKNALRIKMNIFQSINDFNEAKQVISGGVNSSSRAFSLVGGTPPFIARGRGAYIYDEDGNGYIDFMQSGGALIFGHRNEYIESALIECLKDGLSFDTPTEKETTLAKQIIMLSGSVEKVRLMGSGTEANMSAVRLARAFTGRDYVIGFSGCYHGCSDGLLMDFRALNSPAIPNDISKYTLRARYNNMDSVREIFSQNQNVACVIIEAVAGHMGFVPADREFMLELRAFCDEHNILLIIDEVLSGFRVGLQGALGLYDMEADLVSFGGVIGGGLPLAALGGRAEIMDLLSPIGDVYQAGTFNGNPLSTTAGIATLAMLRDNPQIFTELEDLARYLLGGLGKVAQSYSIQMQGDCRGSMFGFFFHSARVKNLEDAQRSDSVMFAKFHQKMLERGVYFAPSSFASGFICTAMDRGIIDEVVVKAQSAFSEIEAERYYE